MKERKSTMIEMVEELEKLPQHPEVERTIQEAKAGEFHDYKNKKYDCGKVAALGFLMGIIEKHPDCAAASKIRDDLIQGVYDEQADEEDKKMMAKDLPNSIKKVLGLEDY